MPIPNMRRAKLSKIIGRYMPEKNHPDTPNYPFYAGGTGDNRVSRIFIRPTRLSDHMLTSKDGLGQPRRHDLVAIYERQKKSQVLLRAPEIISEGCSPFMPVDLQRVLYVHLLKRSFDRIRGKTSRPAVGIDVFRCRREKPASRPNQQCS